MLLIYNKKVYIKQILIIFALITTVVSQKGREQIMPKKESQVELHLIDLATKYLSRFENKDLIAIEKMFAKNVSLIDWEIKADGIEEVLKVNENIFKTIKTIKINIENIYCDNKAIIAELSIIINNGAPLSVIDIIEFDNENNIKEIRAYKQ